MTRKYLKGTIQTRLSDNIVAITSVATTINNPAPGMQEHPAQDVPLQ